MDPNSNKRPNFVEPVPPGTSPPPLPNTLKPVVLSKGVENAKKRLRAFSIQKKTTLSPIVPKPISTGTTTVLIGKLSGIKPTPKIEEDPQKKPPKPPKPGAARKFIQDSYSDQQKRTLSEIEDMKRKMELVDLGIPLGLICPTSTDEKAMPTKAMPPIKTFLDPAKVDELIREAKKARVEGKEFKFDYQKILPDYDNPFQRKREDFEKEHKYDRRRSGSEKRDRKTDKHESRRYSDYRKDDRDKYKERDKDKSKDRFKSKKDTSEKETDVNLKDFLVCDSWSENDDKVSSSPKHDDKANISVKKSPDKKEPENKVQDRGTEKVVINISKEPSQHIKESLTKKTDVISNTTIDSPNTKPHKIEKLQPVIDSFKFEIDPNDDEILDIFDESCSLEKYSHVKPKTSFYVSPRKDSLQTTKDMSIDGINDDMFLESVINEIRQDDVMCDETSPDKRLVEYDESPSKDDYDSPVGKRAKERKRASVTPEMDEKMKELTRQKSNYDKTTLSKQRNDYFDRNEQLSQRSEYSNRKDQGSQRSEYFERKDPVSQRSDYSDRKDQDSQRSDYPDKKDHGSQRSDYSERKDHSGQRSDYSDRKDHDSQRTEYSNKKCHGGQRGDCTDRKDHEEQRSNYSVKKVHNSQRSDYSDSKEHEDQRNDYSDRKDGSQRSNYSDGRQSTESGYKTSDTNKSETKYVDNFRLSIEKELDEALQKSMDRSTVESLETWSFVLKICQPLLFRHDKNKCYRETHVTPKLWYTENPKVCSCVKDRAIVYEELEMLKMGLVDRVYGCDQNLRSGGDTIAVPPLNLQLVDDSSRLILIYLTTMHFKTAYMKEREELADTPSVNARAWYPRSVACLTEGRVQPVAVDWEADESQQNRNGRALTLTPQKDDEVLLDREYQRFMEAVWPDVAEAKASETSRSTTPVRQESRRKKKDDNVQREADDKKPKKVKLSIEGWSQESDVEEESEKSKKIKGKEKEKTRKRKRSSSTLSSNTDSDGSSKKKRKMMKVKSSKKAKSKEAKQRRMGKKLLKKLKEKQKQKKKVDKDESEDLEMEEVKKKESKKAKKRKQQKLNKKNQKRRRKTSSSPTDVSSSSGSDSESETRSGKSKKRKKTEGKKKKRDKRTKSSSESQSEDLFDVNILNNIKTERLTDDEKCQKLMEFSPRIHHKPREIINVKELQNDFVGNNNIHIKKEVDDKKDVGKEAVKEVEIGKNVTKMTVDEVEVGKDVSNVIVEEVEIEKDVSKEIVEEVEIEKDVSKEIVAEVVVEKKKVEDDVVTPRDEREKALINLEISKTVLPAPVDPPAVEEKQEKKENKAIPAEPPSVQPTHPKEPPQATIPDNVGFSVPTRIVDESTSSQCSSQETVSSVKETPNYEKDESHLRPSSQNANYNFNDAIPSQSTLYQKTIETIVDTQDHYQDEPGNYEMYEQLAMAYQSDVASLLVSRAEGVDGEAHAQGVAPQRIETVVRVRARGEIKCDWRADHPLATPPTNRPSRWGLKPSEVNIVLTGGEQEPPPPPPPLPPAPAPQPVYRIQSLANRTDVVADYDEAYMDMYGASDRLQYGDCFATDAGSVAHIAPPPAVTDIALGPMTSSLLKTTPPAEIRSTLDARIDQVLRQAALDEKAAAANATDEQKDMPEKGILITAVGGVGGVAARGSKRVSFADGYEPGQDSDLEDPPVKKRRKNKVRRVGCAWPCPASHPDHVPLWDALPPPPPPPGDPPRSCRQALAMRQATRPTDPATLMAGFMPPEPPPGLISF